MTRLALLRHGHTHWNRQGRIQGRTDIPLDAEATEQLSQLSLPAPWAQANLIASPLSRAMETAALVAGRAATPMPALMEMDWGDWEGQKGEDLIATPDSGYRHIEEWGWDYRPPNGESPADLRARLSPLLESLDKDTVAVCHIGIMRVILAMATHWDFTGPAPFRIKRNRLFVVEIGQAHLSLLGEPVRLEAKA